MTDTLDTDHISSVKLSYVTVPLPQPVSDAKVCTGRQQPLEEIPLVLVEIYSSEGWYGIGFGYSKRAGGPGMFAHAKEIVHQLLGEDPNDIQKIWNKLCWAGASMGRSGLAVQAIAPFDIALWDMKAKRAGLPLAKLLGAHRDLVRVYNTSGGFLSTPIEQMLDNIDVSLSEGIGGIKIKVGHPDTMIDLKRVEAVREKLNGAFPLMVDANQQWDRTTARRLCRSLEQFDLTWIEEPLDAYDMQGHAALASELVTPIATGEMLTSFREHAQLIGANAVDFIQPDAPRVGGITPFLQIMQLADYHSIGVVPHFAMEVHIHLAAVYPRETWVEHFEWLAPLFNEKLEIENGRMPVPKRSGLGLSISEQATAWTKDSYECSERGAE
jgi:L-alanine-DL-glutamate epimerase-like enolase superfamily enzyme